MDVTRLPPAAEDAERGAISCIARSADAADAAVNRIGDAGFFSHPSNVTIYRVICDLRAKQKPVDFISIKEALKASGDLDGIGGTLALGDILKASPCVENIEHYLDVIHEKWTARKLIEICTEAASAAYHDADITTLAHETRSKIESLLEIGVSADTDETTLKNSVQGFIEHLCELYERGDAITGLPFGIKSFDEHTGGMQPAEMWVVCGFTKSGKTALAMQSVIVNASAGVPCSLFSLEMTRQQIIGRAISWIGKVAGGFFRKPRLMNENEYARVTAAATAVSNLPIRVHETKRSLSKISAALQRDVRKFGTKLAVIDYTQLVDGEKNSRDNREREVAAVSCGIKRLAVQLKIPIILLSQTNDDGRLRESRAIGQDADAVIKVRVPTKEKTKPPEPDLSSDKRTIQIEYARSFEARGFEVRFVNAQTRFEDMVFTQERRRDGDD